MSLPVHHVLSLLLSCLWLVAAESESSTSNTVWSSTEPSPSSSPETTTISCDQCTTQECMDYSGCGFAVEFMVAAQIALGAALLLAVSALSFIIWKMCFRNSIVMLQRRNRVRAFCGLPELPRRTSASSSLNSVQNFVIQKMRDRPPRYDESPPQMPPCYDEIVPSDRSSARPSISVQGPATLPLYDQLYPCTSRAGSSNAPAAASDAERPTVASIEIAHQGSAAVPPDQIIRPGQITSVLYDEACGGMDNPAFIPEIQGQHI